MARKHFYHAWAAMIQRCENDNDSRFKDYSGRGITVCPEWHDFETFYKWATANGWKPGLQIDRIDNDGPYAPWNCRWITRTENSRNKRTSHFITISGIKRTVTEWSELSGIKLSTLLNRIRSGWTDDNLLSPFREGVQ
jgi:hypothetical protein